MQVKKPSDLVSSPAFHKMQFAFLICIPSIHDPTLSTVREIPIYIICCLIIVYLCQSGGRYDSHDTAEVQRDQWHLTSLGRDASEDLSFPLQLGCPGAVGRAGTRDVLNI